MACGCNKNKQRYQVKVNGKVVFVSANEGTANAVARRYPNSEVVPA